MATILLIVHLMIAAGLVGVVLLQKSEGGALGMGGSGVFTGRGQANALTRATGILATIFFITSIALTVLPAWERRSEGGDDWTKALDPGSIQIKELPKGDGKGEQAAPEKAPEPGKDSIFDQLQRAQQKRQQEQPLNNAPVWREVRSGDAHFTTVRGPETGVLIQSEGQTWRALRNGPVTLYGGVLLLASTIDALARSRSGKSLARV